MNKTKALRQKDISRNWYLFDAKNKILGRVSTEIAKRLMGKNKSYYMPYLDCGDYVVVINAKEIKVTGNKDSQKIYRRYSGYPGGQKKLLFKHVIVKNPGRIIIQSVSGMLPKNKLRQSMLRRLYVFPENTHPYKSKFT